MVHPLFSEMMSRASHPVYGGSIARRPRWKKAHAALQASSAFADAAHTSPAELVPPRGPGNAQLQEQGSPVSRPSNDSGLGTPLLPQADGSPGATAAVAVALHPGGNSSFGMNLIGAMLSCFLTATGGISLGTVIFPCGVDPQWLTIGMNIGLLTAFVANVVFSLRTSLPVAVGGTLIPAITVLSDFMEAEIGPDEPDTVLAALAVNTFCFGALVFIAGKVGVDSLVKSCPYAVFVGFLGYTGLSLLIYSIQIVDSNFTDITDLDAYQSLFQANTTKQLLPPVLVAVAVAMLKRDWSWKPHWMTRLDAFLVPIVAVLMTGVFYATCFGARPDVSTDEILRIARSEGWVFGSAQQHSVTSNTTTTFSITEFTHVWTARSLNRIKWDLLASSSFATLVFQTFAIGCLTLVEDAFATAQFCSSRCPGSAAVDIDSEVQTGGIANMVLALVGGLPANVVFSYSATVLRIGASNRVFFLLQALMSSLFFVFGNQIVRVMPKMIPSFLLFWVGLDLSMWALWDLRPHNSSQNLSDSGRRIGVNVSHQAPTVIRRRPGFDRIEYCVVVTMTLVGILQGSGLMMVVGLLFAFVITLWRMRNISIVHRSGSLQTFRSTTNRPANDVKVIDDSAERTQIIVLARTSLSFHNVAALADVTEQVVAHASTRVQHCVLDFASVTSISFDSCQTFSEILELANAHNFQLIFTGLQDHIADALVRAGVPMMFGVLSAPLAEQLDGDTRGCVLCPVLLDKSGEPTGCADLNTALAVCEDDLLIDERRAICEPIGSSTQCYLPTDTSRNQDQENSRRAVVSAFPELNDHAVTPVLVDMYNWSKGYFPAAVFQMDMLLVLSRFLEVCEFRVGDFIYEADSALPREPTGAPNPASTPPLIWLLHGAIEHRWSSTSSFGSTQKQIASNYNISEGTPFETAEVDAVSSGRYAIGPLGTHTAFFACMPHCGIIVAVAGSRKTLSPPTVSCAILTREAYDRMREGHPDVANLLACHCARKRWTNMAKSVNDGRPMLVL